MNTVTMQCRLLIVDDEVAQMKALCNTLEMEGYATTGYSSPRQALASLRAGEVDLLLTDLMMPEMDGISLLKAAREVDGNLAGIVMTGQGTIDTAVKAMQHGALDYILKPFKLSAVLTVLARAREVRQLRLDNAALQDRERGYIAELEAANKDLDAFSCSVSHDLRAPLRAITGFCEMYLTDYGQDVPAAGRQLLDRVVNGAARMDRLIEDLLSFCRYSRQPLLKGAVKLDAIARKVVEELQLREAGRTVEWRVGALPECNGDASLLQQVLTNLLSNAFKFTRQRNPAIIEVGWQRSRRRSGALRAGQRRRLRHAVRRQAVRRFPAAAFRERFRRHRRWPVDRPADRPAARRADLGAERAGSGRHVLFHSAAQLTT